MPGKYGPHGELFLFLIQEPATEQVGDADICTSHFSAEFSRSVEEGGDERFGGRMEDGLPTESKCGRVKAKLGRMKMRLLPSLVKAMCAMMRCTLSGYLGPVTRSL